MKKYLIPATLICFILFSACNKDVKKYSRDDLRLVTMESVTNGITHRTNIEYDANGKITRISNQTNGQQPITQYDIQYSSGEVLMIAPPQSSPASEIRDSIRLVLGPGNRLDKRIQHTFFEVKPPHQPQRTYTYDTVTYQYDADGLLLKENKANQDSTWFTTFSGEINTSNFITTGISNYTNTGGKLVSVNYSRNTTVVSRTPTNIYTHTTSGTSTTSFEYTQPYQNKTDYSNAAILKELNVFGAVPLNQRYPFLPNKLTSSYIDKGANGEVTSSGSYTITYQFTYNILGVISSRIDPENNSSKVTYVYKL